MSRNCSRAGFALIEILVVIAIIAILATILFPLFPQTRNKAREVAQKSKQLQLGLAAYANDTEEGVYFFGPQ